MDLITQISNYIYDLENKHKLSMLNKMYYSLLNKENYNITKDYLLYFTFPNDVDLINNNYHLKIEKYTFSLIMEINNEMIFVKKFPLLWNSFNYTFGIKIYNEIFLRYNINLLIFLIFLIINFTGKAVGSILI